MKMKKKSNKIYLIVKQNYFLYFNVFWNLLEKLNERKGKMYKRSNKDSKFKEIKLVL